jgi:septum formation protein
MLYLASTSSRRIRLLAAAGIGFETVMPGAERPAGGGPEAGDPLRRAAERAARKARGAVLPPGATGFVLGVDTVVSCGGVEYGKPADAAAARRTLHVLAAAGEHAVHSALCLIPVGGETAFERVATAVVRCRVLAPRDLEAYLASELWRGKAGAYGIQDDGCSFVELVRGELDTVIGLPMEPLRELLRSAESEAARE